MCFSGWRLRGTAGSALAPAPRHVENGLRIAASIGAGLCLMGTAFAQPLAFPGALGFGAGATGGRGGPIVHVTSLDGHGAGTLRSALEGTQGPRIVVFDVGGVIHLSDEVHVPANVTVLGQTAPGDGVTLMGARVSVIGSNVILRGLHVRPGKGDGEDLDARDSISVGNEAATVRDVIIDHNSVSWATDENMSTWYDVSDVTFSNNIIAEGLLKAGHSEVRHSMGLLIGQTTRRISVLRNLFLSNFWRNPQIEQTEGVEVINNLMVNYGPGGVLVSQGPSKVDMIGNVLVAGADTPDVESRPAIEVKSAEAGSAFYVHDNQTPLGPDVLHGEGAGLVMAARVVSGIPADQILPATAVRDAVLSLAGARMPDLDPVDQRFILQAQGNAGQVVSKSWTGVDWRPADAARPAGWDTDGDGIPDTAEATLGTNPNLPDADKIDPSTGYAYIELYANALLAPGTP